MILDLGRKWDLCARTRDSFIRGIIESVRGV